MSQKMSLKRIGNKKKTIFLGVIGFFVLGGFVSVALRAIDKVSVEARGVTDLALDEDFQKLVSKSRLKGKVRVIVELNTTFRAEGDFRELGSVSQQRRRIDSLQKKVLQMKCRSSDR